VSGNARSCDLEPHVAFGLMGREIVEDDMDFATFMIGDNLVHANRGIRCAAAVCSGVQRPCRF